MTHAEGQRLANELAKNEAVRTLGAWTLEQDERTGAICYYNPTTKASVFCTPGWEAEGDAPPFISLQSMTADGECVEAKDIPFDGTPEGFRVVMAAELAR